jgi:ATP-dependent protease ClpP protease subunit
MANKAARFKLIGVIASKEEAEYFGYKEYVSAADVAAFIEENKKAKSFEIEISSPGGNADQALEMYDRLVKSGVHIDTEGFQVHSAATLIFLLGEQRLISKYAGFTPHNARIPGIFQTVTKEDLREVADTIEKYDDKMVDIYATRLGLDEAGKNDLIALMKEDKDIGSDGAIKYGFATGFMAEDKPSVAAFRSTTWTDKIAASVMPKNENIKNDTEMSKENNSLLKELGTMITALGKKLGVTAESETVKATALKMSDGTEFYFKETDFAKDIKVFSDPEMTKELDDNTYELEDKRKFTVVGGIVTEITDAPAADDATALKEAQDKVAALEKKLNEKTTEQGELKKDLQAIVAKTTELSKLVPGATNLKDFNPDGSEKEKKSFADMTPLERHRAARAIKDKAFKEVTPTK